VGMVRLWGERFVFRGFFESMAPTPFFRVGCDASSTEHVCLCARFLVEKRSKTPLPPLGGGVPSCLQQVLFSFYMLRRMLSSAIRRQRLKRSNS